MVCICLETPCHINQINILQMHICSQMHSLGVGTMLVLYVSAVYKHINYKCKTYCIPQHYVNAKWIWLRVLPIQVTKRTRCKIK